MLLWAVKDKYFSFIGYFSKNILIFFSFLYRSIELLYKKEVKFVEKKIKGLVLFFFIQDLLAYYVFGMVRIYRACISFKRL